MNKLLCGIIIALSSLGYGHASGYMKPDWFTMEKIEIRVNDTLKIKSTLYLPKSNVEKIIIELESIVGVYKHPDFTLNRDTVAYPEIYNLTKEKTGFLLLNSRLPATVSAEEYIKKYCYVQTNKTLAEDAIKALNFLRSDSRFAKIPIGIMGGSAVGVSVAMAAVDEPGFSFVVMNVTPSTNSLDEAEYMWERDRAGTFITKGIFEKFWNYIEGDRFIYKGYVYREMTGNSILNQFQTCAWDCYMEINRKYLAKTGNLDTIQFYAKKLFKESFSGNDLLKVSEDSKVGERKSISANQYIDMMVYYLYSPANVCYLKWDPENYYPKINCPVLMLFADQDTNIDFEGSLANSKAIVSKYKKENFTIDVIKGVDHLFSNQTGIVHENNGIQKRVHAKDKTYFKILLSWLNSITG